VHLYGPPLQARGEAAASRIRNAKSRRVQDMPINAAATACVVRALGFRDSRLQSDIATQGGEARSVPAMRDAHLGISGM
jgi:ferric-dicitrate binding protein FerR (iron transport regulator)